ATAVPLRIQEPLYDEDAAVRRRQRRSARGNSRLSYGIRRSPVLFERVDINNPASPPTSHQRDVETGQPTIASLTTFQEMLTADITEYQEQELPPRFWGYARWG
ncbi:hypothetical protein L915_22016, partial [Phytophthora nicotianae]